jgi:hypothetical protein
MFSGASTTFGKPVLVGWRTSWTFAKPNPPTSPRVIRTLSEASGGLFVQPLPTRKEKKGLNSPERYTSGRRAFSSSGRGGAY